MIGLLLGSIAGVAVLAWYMQRRAPRRVQLSFARLLPDPPENPRATPRFTIVPPVRSVPFWMHLLAILLCITAMALEVRISSGSGQEQIGLRIVIDVSHSMSVADDAGTRMYQALDIARQAVSSAEEAANGGDLCIEMQAVGAIAVPVSTAYLGDLVARPEAGDVQALLRTALADPVDCAITHVLIVSDLTEPVIDPPAQAPALIWRQVGEPRPNAGITAVAYRPPQLGGEPAELTLTVETFGDIPPPVLTVAGPDGTVVPSLEPSIDRTGRFLARLPLVAAGDFQAHLEGGGAYDGDDRVRFSLETADRVAIDWRLDALPPPPGTGAAGAGALVVTDLGRLDAGDSDGPVLAVYDGWRNASAKARLGAFVEDADLFEPLNFDALEQDLPTGLTGPLPPGFYPVLQDENGAVIVARRGDPPGLIMPAPQLGAAERVEALSLTLFFTGLQSLTGGGEKPVSPEWIAVGGTPVSSAWKESDTARPLTQPEAELSLRPARAPEKDVPLGPWLVVAALAAMMVERLWALAAIAVWRAVP